MAEQFEAAILQNFLLVQADKHGHQLLAALPGIAGQAQSVAESEKTDSDESSNNSFDENINNMGSRSSALDLRHQLQQLHQIQTLQQLSQLQQLQQGGRIALSRLGNSGPVIHKPVWRHEKPVKPEMPTILPVRRGEAQPSSVELRQNFVILSKSEIKEEEVEEQMEQDPLRIRDPVHEPEQTLILNQNRGQEQTRSVSLKRMWATNSAAVPPPPPLIPATGKTGKSEPVKKRDRGRGNEGVLLCQVCGERAGKHSYYGGQVCPSCRAFFRRSVQSRCYLSFRCINRSEECTINLLTRKNCQACRYQKCLACGMRPSWILSEEERIRRFHGRAKGKTSNGAKEQPAQCGDGENMEVEQEPAVSPVPLPPTIPPAAGDMSAEDRFRILQFTELIKRSCTGRCDDLDASLVSELVSSTTRGSALPRKTAERLSCILDSRTRNTFMLLQDFERLGARDQTSILRTNLPLIHRLRQTLCLHNPDFSLGDLVVRLVGEKRVQEVERSLPFDLSSNNNVKHRMEYCNLLRDGLSAADAQKHDQLVTQVNQIVNSEDTVLLVLLVLVIAFNPDFLDLQDRTQVEQIQLKYVLMLQQYLSSGGGEPVMVAKGNQPPPEQTQPLNLAKPSPEQKELAGLLSEEENVRRDEKKEAGGLRFIKMLMVPALLRQILELTRNRLLL